MGRSKKAITSHKLLIEDEQMQDVVRSPNSQEIVDMLKNSTRSKIFHPNGGSLGIIPCKVKKAAGGGKLTVEICPFMRPELGIHRFRVRLKGCRGVDNSIVATFVRNTPLHLISLGEFKNGRYSCVVWNWAPETELPDYNPKYELSMNARIQAFN